MLLEVWKDKMVVLSLGRNVGVVNDVGRPFRKLLSTKLSPMSIAL